MALTLALSAAPAFAKGKKAKKAKAPTWQCVVGGNTVMRFLIVDDDESVILFLRMILSAYAECLTACNGVEALSAFEAALDEDRPFTAVFMDILMPDMNGTEVVQELRRFEDEHGQSVPFKLIMEKLRADMAEEILRSVPKAAAAVIREEITALAKEFGQ